MSSMTTCEENYNTKSKIMSKIAVGPKFHGNAWCNVVYAMFPGEHGSHREHVSPTGVHQHGKLSHPRSDNRRKIHVYFFNRHTTSEYVISI